MIRTVTPRGNFRLYRIPAIALFLSCLALPFAFASEPAGITPEVTQISAPRNQSAISTRPFSHVAIGASFGTLGGGIEVATPISRKTNLRVDSHFFNYNLNLSNSGVQYNGTLNLRDTRISYDFFPWGRGFRISGGVAVYNRFNVGANGMVPGGTSFTFNDTDYYSSAANPMHGTASLSYARTVAPTVTIGWGNAIPRSGRHLAFPFEFGAAFPGTPKFTLNPSGEACTAAADAGAIPGQTCAVITPTSGPAGFTTNLNQQIQKINKDVAPLRVYPILNMGVTYRF